MKRINKKIYVILIFIILMISFIIIYFLNSNKLFSINEVNIICENEDIKSESYEKTKNIRGKNILKISKNDIKKEILKNEYVDDVNIEINLPDQVDINIKAKEIEFMVKQDNNYYLIDDNYQVVKETKEIEDNYIYLETKYNIKNDALVIEDEDTENIVKLIFNELNKTNIKDKLNHIKIDDNYNVSIITNENTNIILNEEKLGDRVCYIGDIIQDLEKKDVSNGVLDMTNDVYKAVYSPST